MSRSYQWYLYESGRRHNLGKPRDHSPGWLARLMVWGMRAPWRGRLCWVYADYDPAFLVGDRRSTINITRPASYARGMTP